MKSRGSVRNTNVALVLGALLLIQTSAHADDLFVNIKDYLSGGEEPLTLKDVACLVDCVDKELFKKGTIGIKSPDVWGQNRMTAYRAEFEAQMAQNLGNFQLILQAAQRRSDVAVLTNATQLSATVAAAAAASPATSSGGSGGLLRRPRSSAIVLPTIIPTSTGGTAPGPAVTVNNNSTTSTPSGSGGSAGAATHATTSGASSSSPSSGSSSSANDPSSLLDDISQKLAALQSTVLQLPSNISNFATATGQPGVGIEPTIQLDEQANYINHLHQLRRVNGGDDLTDLAGYGLYLLRLPVSLVPGPDSRKGKGAIVTMEARHELAADLLPDTFRDVVIMDLTFALTQVINEEIHNILCLHCAPASQPAGAHTAMSGSRIIRANYGYEPPPQQPPLPAPPDDEQDEQFRTEVGKSIPAAKTGAGPNSAAISELRIILGPTSWPNATRPPSPKKVQADQVVPEPVKPGGARPAPAPAPELRENGTNPGGREIPRVIQPTAYQPDALGLGVNARPIPTALQGEHNRLRLLVDAINGGQQDPYRHDPNTLSLIREALLETHRFMRRNELGTQLFQQPIFQTMGERYLRKDYQAVIQAREEFLKFLVGYRNNLPLGQTPPDWEKQLTVYDLLAFVLELQSVVVDWLLKEDMKGVFQRNGSACEALGQLFFYELNPSPDARRVFNDYVAAKWPLHVYSIDPVVDQQNVLDAFSRRTELQLALAVAMSTGKINVSNATKYARELDLDLETVGLNRTSVAFGAGETTFGWKFYPRVQTPPTQSNPRRIASLLYWNGPRPDYDLANRRIEPGQRECIALIVTPNFIPSLRLATVANWFDVTNACAQPRLTNGEMLTLSRKLQRAKHALNRICDSGEYRPTDLMHLTRRVKQLEELLPTQDYDVQLPDEGDLMGSEMFSNNSAGLAPTLLAWFGEHPQEGQNSTIFLLGRGFNVFETRVVAGGCDVPNAQKRLVSRNVMEIVIPANARVYKHYCMDQSSDAADHVPGIRNPDPMRPLNPDPTRPLNPFPGQPLNPDPSLPYNTNPQAGLLNPNPFRPRNPAPAPLPLNPDPAAHLNPDPTRPLNPDPTKPKQQPCGWAIIDVHIATPNGISNHLYVETDPKPTPQPTNNLVLTATTSTTVNPQQNNTTTSTRVESTPPGLALPPLTVLPLGGQLPPFTTLAPGAVTGAPAGSLFPGMNNSPAAPATVPPPVLDPTAPNTGAVPSTPGAAATPAPSASPPAAQPTPHPAPAQPVFPAGQRAPLGTALLQRSASFSEPVMQTSYTPSEQQVSQRQPSIPSIAAPTVPAPATVVRGDGAPARANQQPRASFSQPVSVSSAVARRAPATPSRPAAAKSASAPANVTAPPETPPARRSILQRLGLSNR
jgi:hypothetical protein